MLEVVIGGFTLSLNVLIPAVVLPGLFFGVLALYPWIEGWATGDRGEKHVLDRPATSPLVPLWAWRSSRSTWCWCSRAPTTSWPPYSGCPSTTSPSCSASS